MKDGKVFGKKALENTMEEYTEDIPKADVMSRVVPSSLSGVNLEVYLSKRYLYMQQSAERRGIEFSITLDDLRGVIKDECFFLGIPVFLYVRVDKLKAFDQFTIDRVDPSEGYVKGNIVACSYKANVLKSLVEYNTDPFEKIINKMSEWNDKKSGVILSNKVFNNTSGKLGVTFHKGKGKWEARGVNINGKAKYLGTFSNKESAVLVREAHEIEVLGGTLDLDEQGKIVFIGK